MRAGLDWYEFTLAFKDVHLEGLEGLLAGNGPMYVELQLASVTGTPSRG